MISLTSAMLTNPILFSYNETMKEKKNASNEQLNILQVHNFYRQSGGEDVVVENERKLLEKHGHHVSLYARHNDEITGIKSLFLPFQTIFSFKTYREVRTLIKKNHIDLIHVHNTLPLISPSVFRAARSCHIPAVMTVHNYRLQCIGATCFRQGEICEECIKKDNIFCGVKYGCYRDSRLQSAVSAFSICVHELFGTYRRVFFICLTEFQKDMLLNKHGFHKKQMFVKPHFADVTDADDSKNTYDSGNTDGAYYLYIGRLEEEKGIRTLLKAFRRYRYDLEDIGENCRLIICGDGSLKKECTDYCKKHMPDSVEFKGTVEHKEALNLIKNAKALIVPSLWHEPFGMVAVEANALKTPIIASDIGALRDLVKDGENGKLFAVGDAEALSDLLKRFQRKDLKKLQPTEYLKQTEAEANYQQLINIYERCIQYVRNHKKK